MRLSVVCLVAALGASSARAHIVPVDPSTCVFDPVSLAAPDLHVTATAVPATAADDFTIFYDPQASQAQFDLTDNPPRAFTANGVNGSLSVSPPIFVATLRNSGDLTATPSLAVTVGGATTIVPTSLTTGLAAAAGTLVEGTPIGKTDGHFVLVGFTANSGLPAPLNGPLIFRLACNPQPRPDTDQFRVATQTTPLSATLTAQTLRVRAIFAPGAMDVADFAGRPALLHVTSGATTIATVDLPGLPRRSGKLFIGRTADGSGALGVRALRRSGQLVYLLAIKVKQPTMPPATGGPAQVRVTFDVGGLLSRVTLAMRAKRQGAKLVFP